MRSIRADANRVFAYALLASLLLHAPLLGLDWPKALHEAVRRPAELLGPIVARLVEPPAPAPVAEKEKRKPPSAQAQPSARRTPAARIAAPEPAPEPAPAPAPAAEAAPPASALPAPAPAPAPAPLSEVAKAGPPAAPAPAVSEASLIAQFRASILDAARRYKRYPLAARDNGWEGEVVVRVSIGADGALGALRVLSSSGHALLDREALDMFRRATPQAELPTALRGKAFALELRAVFSLQDQDSG